MAWEDVLPPDDAAAIERACRSRSAPFMIGVARRSRANEYMLVIYGFEQRLSGTIPWWVGGKKVRVMTDNHSKIRIIAETTGQFTLGSLRSRGSAAVVLRMTLPKHLKEVRPRVVVDYELLPIGVELSLPSWAVPYHSNTIAGASDETSSS